MGPLQLGLVLMFAGLVGAPVTRLWWLGRRRELRHVRALTVLAVCPNGDPAERRYLDADARERRVDVAVEATGLVLAAAGAVLMLVG